MLHFQHQLIFTMCFEYNPLILFIVFSILYTSLLYLYLTVLHYTNISTLIIYYCVTLYIVVKSLELLFTCNLK